MTYPKTLIFFVLPAIALALFAARAKVDRRFGAALVLLLVVVYAATAPWDNLAVKWGIWCFDWDKTWGIRIGYLPLEEYLFFGLQTVLAALVWRTLARPSGSSHGAGRSR